MSKFNFLNKIYNIGPVFLLYYLSISEVDTNLEKIFEIFTFNLPIIIIYFWILKKPSIMGTGHIFVAGLINDVVMGFPLGISSLSYLVVCFFSNYVRNKSINTTIASDWFTFFIALIFTNLFFGVLLLVCIDLQRYALKFCCLSNFVFRTHRIPLLFYIRTAKLFFRT